MRLNHFKNFTSRINFFYLTVIVVLLAIYGILLAQKIDLVTADLGRHLKNGEMFFENFSIPKTNLYSYTFPDFPFVCHHWGSGVIFFLIHKLAGFAGLSAFFVVLSLTTFFLFFHLAWRFSRFGLAVLVSIFVIPVLGARTEIRPEVFSYFFCGLFLWLLFNFRAQKISWRWLWLLPIFTLFWVNLHIYFFLGLFLVGVFLFEALILFILKKNKDQLNIVKKLAIILTTCFLTTFVNPAGLKGALYYVHIFDNYGYRLLENQSVWFLAKIISYPPSLYFEIAFGLLILSWLIILIKKRPSFNLANFILTLFFSVLGWLAIRNFTIFGYFALPLAAINLKSLYKKEETSQDYPNIFTFLLLALLFLFIIHPAYWLKGKDVGLGLKAGVEQSINFFQKENLQGPIFNNYDIGSYLVYYLYPGQRVFVDNRPEAYPSSFFTDDYVPAQEDEQKWLKLDQQYNFNAIYFYRHDLTPWAQEFLVRKISDAQWAPVFVDDYTIIFLKRNEINHAVIEKYELPKEMFSVGK